MIFTKVGDVKSPCRANDTDAGIDFYVPNDFSPITLDPQKDILIPLGIKVQVPNGYALIAFNKSGVATKKKFVVGACCVDVGYEGVVHCHILNAGTEPQYIEPGMKIVQFVLLPISSAHPKEVSNDEYTACCGSNRGAGGFGSTGI